LPCEGAPIKYLCLVIVDEKKLNAMSPCDER
jgi:hypothetical protein